ncbi:hypothetical protein VV02_07025 [Luteipulveratus mongoliensis]|uniref:Aminoglycoside phosphotransferase domain-containing protein n=2 Tax=Luteipulveratus mongoliensis TaxID=571913 RepID=A0A0K1JPS6_9MICO|nr:hypothetical protein VV02_07025 [Luteipulveratus mongoliensis]
MPLTELTFTPATTGPVLDAVCGQLLLDPSNAVLLRHHTNAVYRLVSAPIVVKISRPGARDVESTVNLVRWLAAHDVPSVSLVDEIEQPITVAGCEITLWKYLPQIHEISAGDIATPLAALHRTPPPPDLPRLDPMPDVERSLAASRFLSDDEKTILQQRSDELTTAWVNLKFDSGGVLLHTDPQHRNTLWEESGKRAVLCDWESATIGPAEWDLVTIEIHCRRFGHETSQMDEFCRWYGRDVRDWPGYVVVRDIRELKMIASNARKSAPGTPHADEVRRRIALLDDGPERRWYIL